MKAIVFDMDGVLIDSMKSHVFAWEQVFLDYGIEVKDLEIYEIEGERNMDVPATIAKNHGVELSTDEINFMRDQKMKIYQTFDVKPYDILFYLYQLKSKGIKLAVGTGGRGEIAHEKIERFFPGIFDAIVTSDDVSKGKPEPDTYLKACEKLAISPAETIVIENAPYGVKAGKVSGARVYAVKTTLTEKELCEADIVFDDHAELFTHILSELEGKL